MFRSFLSRPLFLRLNLALVMVAQMMGWVVVTGANQPAPPPPPRPPASLRAVRRGLREFDRFLDHHPLLETQLRLSPRLVATPTFLEENQELAGFLRANPTVLPGLETLPRYFLNRALIREASAPISYAELAPLKDFFQEQPLLEKKLIEDPELIRDPAFLKAHAVLPQFLHQHPALAAVYLPPAGEPYLP